MNELLVPFDRELKEVPETLNMQCILDIVFFEISLIERKKCSNEPQVELWLFR